MYVNTAECTKNEIALANNEIECLNNHVMSCFLICVHECDIGNRTHVQVRDFEFTE